MPALLDQIVIIPGSTEPLTHGRTRKGNLGEPVNLGIAQLAVLAGGVPRRVFVRPNVRAKRATTAGRQARAVQDKPRRRGPGGLPLGLRLNEGLGVMAAVHYATSLGGELPVRSRAQPLEQA